MTLRPAAALVAATLSLSAIAPARAQLFYQLPDYRGAPIAAGEAGIGVALPAATPDEERAGLAWQMRAGLNVAALQCQFDPLLQIKDSYAGVLTNHREELATVYTRLTNYFKRTAANPKAGQDALDRYGTRTYTGFSTIQAQLSFCQTASRIARSAQFVPRGSFTTFAVERLRELRGALTPGGEQLFRPTTLAPQLMLDFSAACWDRRGRYKGCPLIAV